MDERRLRQLPPFLQWQTPEGYARQTELTFAHCDRNRQVRPAALLSLMAAAAGYDYDARGLPYETLYAMREVFLLSRMALRIHRRPTSGEVLTVSTWEDGAKGAHLRRVFELTGQTGETLVSGRSEWILVDPLERKILRPAAFTGKPITTCPKEIHCPDCRRVTPPPGVAAERLGERSVRWSDLDGNGHVYSANYADIAWDALPSHLQDRPLAEFYIHYSKEATLGDTLALEGFGEETAYTVIAAKGEEHCFSCRCVFAAAES